VSTAGIILNEDKPLAALVAPIAAELSDCYWLIDSQAGWGLPPESQDELYDEKFVRTDACEYRSCSCWRPGTFPEHADDLLIDEWTYLFAMRCEASDVERRAARLVRRLGRFDAEFFDGLEAVADAFFMHVDGWWEIYTFHREWRRRLCQAFPGATERTCEQVGRPPT
jgi:hypothetical protein